MDHNESLKAQLTPYEASERTAQKTPLPSVLLLLHHIAIGRGHTEHHFPLLSYPPATVELLLLCLLVDIHATIL
jgi:hypothetical protein